MVKIIKIYYILSDDDEVIAKLEKTDDGEWGLCKLAPGNAIGHESLNKITKKLKELNNAEI